MKVLAHRHHGQMNPIYTESPRSVHVVEASLTSKFR